MFDAAPFAARATSVAGTVPIETIYLMTSGYDVYSEVFIIIILFFVSLPFFMS